ncbi:MAG: thrombospondin type 3 repeat-containing protein, partial [Myxococcota bacterium]
MSDVRRLICVGLVIWLGATLWGCSAEPFVPRTAGEACSASSECADSLCYESQCLDPARDDDNDGLTNAIEGQLGTDPLSADTDGDGLPDKIEVGTDIANPLNEDGDDFIDAVESNLVDTDGTPDCLVDQKDNPDLPPPEDKAALYNIGCCCGAPCDELGVSVNNEETECVFSEVDGVTMEVLACVTDEPDSDGDGVKDSCDWCSYLPDQSEDDPDGDNVCQLVDNCPLIANPVDDSEEQPDKDGDGLGDPCDPCVSAENDPDGDGVFNCFPSQCDPSEDAECVIDNCPEHHNPDQLDSDGDAAATAYGTDAYGGGDACDNDADNDGVDNDVDEDDDGDGVNDDLDNCPNTPNPADDEGVQLDTDGDGQGDACDPCPTLSVNDKDSDGFLDCDTDGDGDIEDPCVDEPEYVDGDNKPVCEDNCPEVANPSQFDSDGDGLGDACDDNPFVSDDIDGDGVLNDDDACPESPQAQAADQDLDGDGCFNSED